MLWVLSTEGHLAYPGCHVGAQIPPDTWACAYSLAVDILNIIHKGAAAVWLLAAGTEVTRSYCCFMFVGDELTGCDLCPVSYHIKCLSTSSLNPHLCSDCAQGRPRLYGDMVWVKFGSYRYWCCFYSHFVCNFLCLQCFDAVGWAAEKPVKNWVVGCWHDCLSGARCRLA